VKYGTELKYKNFEDVRQLETERKAYPKTMTADFVRFAERTLPLFF
jgi:hypothetical protein